MFIDKVKFLDCWNFPKHLLGGIYLWIKKSKNSCLLIEPIFSNEDKNEQKPKIEKKKKQTFTSKEMCFKCVQNVKFLFFFILKELKDKIDRQFYVVNSSL